MAQKQPFFEDKKGPKRKCSNPHCRFHLGSRTTSSLSSSLPEHLTNAIDDLHDMNMEDALCTDCAQSTTMASLAKASISGENSTPLESEQSDVTATTVASIFTIITTNASNNMSDSEQEEDDEDKENKAPDDHKAEEKKGYDGDDEDDTPEEETDPDKMDTSEMKDMSLDDILHQFLEVVGEIMEATDQILA